MAVDLFVEYLCKLSSMSPLLHLPQPVGPTTIVNLLALIFSTIRLRRDEGKVGCVIGCNKLLCGGDKRWERYIMWRCHHNDDSTTYALTGGSIGILQCTICSFVINWCSTDRLMTTATIWNSKTQAVKNEQVSLVSDLQTSNGLCVEGHLQKMAPGVSLEQNLTKKSRTLCAISSALFATITIWTIIIGLVCCQYTA